MLVIKKYMQVRIYTKDLTVITTLLQKDVESVEFTDKLEGDGSGSFVVRADNSKITASALKLYNRVKFFEDGVCKFYGFITENNYDLNTISIKLFSIGYLLKNRTLGGSYVATGTISTILTNMLSTVNTANPTGISLGTVDSSLTTSYSKTYDSGNDFDYIVKDLLGDTAQYRVDENGLIQVAVLLGTDKSSTVRLRYDVNQIESANITSFKVKESGQNILTEILAKRTGGSVVVSDTDLQTEYGLIQTTKTYQYVSDNTQLTAKATLDLKGAIYSPEITLSPTVLDNFSVCDILGVRLYNKFIDIATSYQVLEKSVSYIGTEKTIRIKLNEKQKDLIDILLDQKQRIKLLENS